MNIEHEKGDSPSIAEYSIFCNGGTVPLFSFQRKDYIRCIFA